MADDKSFEIIISANLKQFEDAMSKIEKQTEALSDTLSSVATKAGVAFAAIGAAVGLSVKAYAEQEQAARELSQSLQQQGIYSDTLLRKYLDLAEAQEKKTGQDAEMTKAGIGLIQGQLGEIQVTGKLVKAVGDLAAAKGIDLKTAYEVVGKSIATSTNALARQGIEIDTTATKTEKMSRIIEQINAKWGGQAEAQAQGLGSLKLLGQAFDEVMKAVGERFAPAITAIANKLSDFFRAVSENKPMIDLIVSIGAGALAFTAMAGTAAAVGLAFLKFKAIMEALRVSTAAMTIVTKGLVGATGLGLLLIVVTEIYLNWNSIWPRMQAIFGAFVNNIGELGSGLKDILMGALSFDADKIAAGMAKVKDALSKGFAEATKDIKPIEAPIATQDAQLKAAAQRYQAIQRQYAEWERQHTVAENQLRVLKASEGTDSMVKLKEQEIEILKSLEDRKNADISAKLEEQLQRNRERQAAQISLESDQMETLRGTLLAENEEFNALTEEQKTKFLEESAKNEQNRLLTESTARPQIAAEKLKAQVDEYNKFLIEEKKFGTAYATIDKALHSDRVKGFQMAGAEMIELQSSQNSTLKGIGKAFAIADITIKSGQSAMNAFSGFVSAFPGPVGVALGTAAAAAAIAFGVEKIGMVTAANEGGIIPGFGPDKDSVFSFLTPGELVVPRRNFDEVVGAVQAQRSGGDNGDVVTALSRIESKLSDRGTTVIQGDILADDVFVDRFISKINDAIEFRNARLRGVTV